MLNASLIDVPRPFLDPIDSLVEALGVVSLAVPRPLSDGTIVLTMDPQRRGLGMVRTAVITPAVMHGLVGVVCQIPRAASVVIVSMRARHLIRPSDTDDLAAHSRVLSNAGLSLLDWIVVGRGGLYCPRSIAGDADPWPSAVSCR